MSSKKLENWIKDFIIYFRQQSQKKEFTSKDFISPCQINVIWLQDKGEPETDYQIFIFTQWEKILDLDFDLEGPKNLSDTINILDSFIKKNKWTKTTLDDETAIGDTYSEALEEAFLHIIQNFDQNPFYKNKIHNNIKIAKDCFCWVFDGKIQEMDIKDIFEMVYKDELVKDNEDSQKIVPISNQAPVTIKGYATFFYPAIWIGDTPNPSFIERLIGSNLGSYVKNVYNTTYNGIPLIVQSDGFLAIGETNKEKALDLLNEIMATALFLKIPNIKIREFELINVEINHQTKDIGSWQGSTGFTRTSLLEERINGDPKWYRGHKIFLKKSDIINVIEKSKEFNQDKEFKNFLGFFFEAFTHLFNTEYSQSFIMSWTIIEKYFYSIWKGMLIAKNKKMNKSRKSNLLNWNLHHILEIINLYENLNDETYELLIKLKAKRNKIVHQGENCSEEDAEECFNLANILLVNGIKPNK